MISDVLHIMSDLCSMGVSQVLRERGEAAWMAAISHPMVRQIGDGTLPHPAWSYAEFARPLMAALPADPVYADWIAMFGIPGYGSLVDETTGLLDRLASAADGTAMGRLTLTCDISTRYESKFWDMVYATPPGGDA